METDGRPPKRSVSLIGAHDDRATTASNKKRRRQRRPRAKKTRTLMKREMHNCHTVILPTELWMEVMSFLTQPELVHRVSKVSKNWCYQLSRHPSFWHVLDENVWKKKRPSRDPKFSPNPVFASCKKFLEFLSRPQFSQLKRFTPPDTYRTKEPRVFTHFAERFPQLQHLDVRGYDRELSVIPRPFDFDTIGTMFPCLTSLCISLRFGGCDDLERCLSTMGERLVKLSVFTDNYDHYFTDEQFPKIAKLCPNLEEFQYDTNVTPNVEFSAKGPMLLLQGCPKLSRVSIMFPFDFVAARFKHDVLVTFHGKRNISVTAEYFTILDSEDESDNDDD